MPIGLREAHVEAPDLEEGVDRDEWGAMLGFGTWPFRKGESRIDSLN